MAESTTLCVSVQAGEHLISGPDWVRIEDSKTLVDVFVEVIGTQALGYQVQVVVSKEPSFTEAALVQVLNLVSMLRESGSIYVKFLLKSNVLPSKQRYEENKCKAERDTDVLSPLDSLNQHKQEKKEDNNIYNFINSIFEKPFESNYLNKLFSEQKISAATLASLKDELAKKHQHKEPENFTTWSQQSRLSSECSDSSKDSVSSLASQEKGLTDWGSSTRTTLPDRVANDTLIINTELQDHGVMETARKQGNDLNDENLRGFACTAEKVDNVEKDERVSVITKKDQNTRAGEASKRTANQRLVKPGAGKDAVKKSQSAKTPLPKMTRSTTLRAKKNAAACAGVLKKEKNDSTKSGMPVLCQKKIRATTTKATTTRLGSNMAKRKDRDGKFLEKESSVNAGLIVKNLKKTDGRSSKKAMNSNTAIKGSKNPTVNCLEKQSVLINTEKSEGESNASRNSRSNESVINQTSSIDSIVYCTASLLKQDSIEPESIEKYGTKEIRGIRKSSGRLTEEENDLSLSQDSGYDVSKDSYENTNLQVCYPGCIADATSHHFSGNDMKTKEGFTEDGAKELQLSSTESICNLQNSRPSLSKGQTFEDENEFKLNNSGHCSLSEELAIRSGWRFENEKARKSPNEGFSDKEILLADSCVSVSKFNNLMNNIDPTVTVKGFTKENVEQKNTSQGSEASQAMNSSFFAYLTDDFSPRKLKSSFDSFDIMDVSEMRRKSVTTIDNCIRRSESLGRDSRSPIHKKSGFFHHLKEKTIEFDSISPSHILENFTQVSGNVRDCKENENSTPLLLNSNLKTKKELPTCKYDNTTGKQSPDESNKHFLNITIDKTSPTDFSLGSSKAQSKKNRDKSPVFLVDIGKDSVASRTFSLENETDGAVSSSSESVEAKTAENCNKERELVPEGEMLRADLKGDSSNEEKLSADEDDHEICRKNDFDKDIECHIRKEWNSSIGVIDQLLLTSLCALTCDLNTTAERILNTIRVENEASSTSSPLKDFSYEMSTEVEDNEETVQLFQRLRHLERQLNRLEENIKLKFQ